MTAVTVVPRDSYLVRWVGREAVVTLPEHFDLSNAGQIREDLLSVIDRGAATLIADMTATLSRDHAGADAVVRAYQRAVANGTQLRLVVTAHIVGRVLSLNGLDRLIASYPARKQPPPPGRPRRKARPKLVSAREFAQPYTLHHPHNGPRPKVLRPSTARGSAVLQAGGSGGKDQEVAASRRAECTSSSRNVASGIASRPLACTG